MQRRLARRVATCAGILALAVLAGMLLPAPSRAGPPPPLAPPLDAPPLAVVRVTGGYGEVRSNHVHAGVDLSTGGRVGAAVRAPLAGWVERVRASGVGYGRSLYVRSRDGRLLVFGHLDAFAPTVARYVDSVQVAGAQYEQDLWPATGRFRFRAGAVIAWSGRSGTGPPHLHFEVRHGDFALNPLRAGVRQAASPAPRVETLVLEPLDERSFVEGGAAPLALRLGSRAETVLVQGRVRAVVRARIGMKDVPDTPAWSTAVEWSGRTLAARLDSISWAGEMSEQDEIFDRGRVTGSGGVILWRPPGFTPRFLLGNGDWDGTIEVRAGDPPRPLRLVARDAGGGTSRRTVWLRGRRAGESDPARFFGLPVDTIAPAIRAPSGITWSYGALPGGRVRVHFNLTARAVKQAIVRVQVGTTALTTGAGPDRVAILPFPSVAAPLEVGVQQEMGGVAWVEEESVFALSTGSGIPAPIAPNATLAVPAADVYEPGVLVARTHALGASVAGGLVPVGGAVVVEPEHFPLRRAVPIAMTLPAGASAAHVDVYRRDGAEWVALRGRVDSLARMVRAETAELGDFALLRDDAPPAISLRTPARHPGRGPYSRWQLVAGVEERGSGVDASRSAFEVDGARVPSEWDPEDRELRWRPAHAPAAGPHRYVIVAADRAGNTARSEGSFVLDSVTR